MFISSNLKVYSKLVDEKHLKKVNEGVHGTKSESFLILKYGDPTFYGTVAWKTRTLRGTSIGTGNWSRSKKSPSSFTPDPFILRTGLGVSILHRLVSSNGV